MLDKDSAKELLEDRTRREFLFATGSLAAVLGVATGSLEDSQGNLSGGTMALDQAYKVAEAERAIYVGPDSAKSEITPDDGDRYDAVDTQVKYHGDGGSWVGPQGVGSSSEPVPAVHTEKVGSSHWRVEAGATGGELQDVIDAASPGEHIVVEGPIQSTQPPHIHKALTLEGEAFSGGGRDLKTFEGSYITVTESTDKLLDITVDKKAVHLRNIGWEYDSGLSSTGHGIVCDSESDGSVGKTLGLQEAHWTNVAVRGVDPDKYCYRFINVQYNLLEALSYKKGGGTEWVIEGQPIHPANTYVINLRGDTEPLDNGADGIHFTADGDTMNFVTFIEPQIAFEPRADQVSTQSFVDYTTLNGGDVREVAFYGPLWESSTPTLNLPSGTRLYNAQGVDTGLDLSSAILMDYGDTRVDHKEVSSKFLTAKTAFQAQNARFDESVAGGSAGPFTISLGGSVGGTNYSVHMETDWQHGDYTTSNKGSGSFDVSFANATPSGGGNVIGFVMR